VAQCTSILGTLPALLTRTCQCCTFCRCSSGKTQPIHIILAYDAYSAVLQVQHRMFLCYTSAPYAGAQPADKTCWTIQADVHFDYLCRCSTTAQTLSHRLWHFHQATARSTRSVLLPHSYCRALHFSTVTSTKTLTHHDCCSSSGFRRSGQATALPPGYC
jgi:hypothetical protein